jgi:Zn finger protein HypA/HybF involved in hydrogenase expression
MSDPRELRWFQIVVECDFCEHENHIDSWETRTEWGYEFICPKCGIRNDAVENIDGTTREVTW